MSLDDRQGDDTLLCSFTLAKPGERPDWLSSWKHMVSAGVGGGVLGRSYQRFVWWFFCSCDGLICVTLSTQNAKLTLILIILIVIITVLVRI